MRRIVEVANVDEPDNNADHGDNLREHVAKVVELLLEWRRSRDLRGDTLMYVTDCGRGSC